MLLARYPHAQISRSLAGDPEAQGAGQSHAFHLREACLLRSLSNRLIFRETGLL
jgi:hypothetical protein